MHVTRVDHVSFHVGDIDRSLAFYARFGFVPLRRYDSAGPDVDAGADTVRADMEIQLLEHPSGGVRLELIRYRHHPAGRAAHNSTVGAAHVCVAVDDVRAAYDELLDAGVEFLSEPHVDDLGFVWVYLRDPDGNAFELMQDVD